MILKRPSIGITCRNNGDLPKFPKLYTCALEKAAADAVFVSAETGPLEAALNYDGLLIPGGDDLDPSLYNEDPVFRSKREDLERTEFEFLLLREIIRLRKPVFGICYGMQLLNVFFKGTLYQDIGSQIPGTLRHTEGTHTIRIGDNTFWERGEFEVNSSHHQAVKDLGRGIRPFALSSDGIIEGIFAGDYGFLAGVQWHPERMPGPLSERLFNKFVGACSEIK